MYRVTFVVLVFVGAVSKLSLVWTISDIFNALMAIPTMVATIMLSGRVMEAARVYFSKPLIPTKHRDA